VDAVADARHAIAEARIASETAILRATGTEGRLRAQVRRRVFFQLSELARHDELIAQIRDVDLPEAQAAAEAARQALDAAHAAYDEAAAAATAVWPDANDQPVLLLPLRLETTYRTAGDSVELWIRAYPDDVHVDSHEPGLTPAERVAADVYAAAVAAAADADGPLAAWRGLVEALGPGRAAWVTEVRRREARGDETAPPRAAVWTRAARAALLPERLVFSGYRRGRLLWRQEGEPIPTDVDLGLAPPGDDGDGGDRAGPWHEAAAWLVDFDAAVARGLAVRVPLTETDLAFDRVTVLGVAPGDGTSAVEDLIEAHTYTDGFAILPTGTPTNNTPESRSGWRSRPPPRTPDEVARQRDDFDPGGLQPAARLARALGIDGAKALVLAPEALHDDGEQLTQHVQAFMGRVVATSRDWAPVAQQPATLPDLEFLREHMVFFVRSRGPLPVLRIGRQPYGVLPATALDLWRGEDVPASIVRGVRSVATAFAVRAGRLPQVGRGPDQAAVLLDILSRRAASRRVHITETSTPDPRSAPPPPTIGAVDLSTAFGLRWPSVPGEEHAVADPPTKELAEFVARRPIAELGAIIDAMVELVRASDPAGEQPSLDELRPRFDALRAALGPVLESSASGVLLPLTVPALHASFFLTFIAELAVHRGADPNEPTVAAFAAMARTLDGLRRDMAALEEEAVKDLGAVERMLCEALDTTSHRLDAWVTSLATARLERLRTLAPVGLRTGAYGWLHDVRPQEPSLRAAHDGYIVAPSLHHATTAAVLRSGWQAHSSLTALAVDLRSGRVRRALALLDGARTGQPLAALLGYRFERGLHESGLDHLIDDYRGAFPLAPQVELGDELMGPARAAVAARNVVDGQALRRGFGTGDRRVDAGDNEGTVGELVAGLDDAVDALGDLLLAESVHHLVGGNPLRAGLSADAIGRGEAVPPELDVVRTPRSSRLITYVAGVLVAASGEDGTGWSATTLGALEPGLERWCAARLGPAVGWEVRVAPDAPAVTLDTLGVGALEAVLGAAADGPLGRRLLRASGAAAVVPGDERLDELLVLCAQLRAVLAGAVPLDESHLDPAGGAGLAAADLGELADRVGGWLGAVRAAASALRAAGDDGSRAAALDALASAGVAVAMRQGDGPPPVPGSPGDDLEARAADVTALLTAADLPASLPAPPRPEDRTATTALEWITAATTLVRRVTGAGFPLLCTLRLGGTEAGRAVTPAHRPAGTPEDAVADAVRDLGRVRPAVRALDDALLGAGVLAGTGPPAWVVAQTPTAAGGAPWIVVGPSAARSCALLAADSGVSPDAVAGFVADTWTELLPDGGADEVAAIAFHHDRPDARAPHALLLAVPPDPERGWCMEDLHAVVDDSFDLARLRGLDLTDLPDLRATLPPTIAFAGTDL
jgi:hypothetical protein